MARVYGVTCVVMGSGTATTAVMNSAVVRIFFTHSHVTITVTALYFSLRFLATVNVYRFVLV